MKNSQWDTVFHEFASLVRKKLQSAELSSAFSDYSQFRDDRFQEMTEWQIALPIVVVLAVDGSLEDGIVLASAWVSLYLASEVLDKVEDKEFISDRLLPSPEVASNLATGLIFEAFHTLSSFKDSDKTCQVGRIFSDCGKNAVYGQHRDLTQSQLQVEGFLRNYWETIILKSGSVFRAATEGGAVVCSGDKTIAEALADYGTALGVMLQLMDDCRDAYCPTQEAVRWEVSLPLLLYLMAIGEESINFPEVSSKAEWCNLLSQTGVILAISELLLQWKTRALDSLGLLRDCQEKRILESIPSLILEQIPATTNKWLNENNT